MNLDWELPEDAEDVLEGEELEAHIARLLAEQVAKEITMPE